MTATASRYGAPHASARGGGASSHDEVLAVRTVADLAGILANLPSQTPVTVDPVLRGASGLSPDQHSRIVVADTGGLDYRRAEGGGGARLPALELSARLIPEEAAPIPPEALACDPLHRMADALDAGDVGDGLRALADALSDAAHDLATEGAAWLPPASPLLGQLNDLTVTLRLVAAEMRSILAAAADAEMRRAEMA